MIHCAGCEIGPCPGISKKAQIHTVMNFISDMDGKLSFLSELTIQSDGEETAKICEELRYEMVEAEKARLDSMFSDGGIVTGIHSDPDDSDIL